MAARGPEPAPPSASWDSAMTTSPVAMDLQMATFLLPPAGASWPSFSGMMMEVHACSFQHRRRLTDA